MKKNSALRKENRRAMQSGKGCLWRQTIRKADSGCLSVSAPLPFRERH